MSTPERNITDLKKGLMEPLITRKPKPGDGFEGTVFKDKPDINPLVKTPLPIIKPDPDKP